MFSFFAIIVVVVSVTADSIHQHPLNSRQLGHRIVGGENTTIQSHPYQISIFVSDIGHICGGSIISAHYVVTAAHCTTYMSSFDHAIRAGSSLNNQDGSIHDIEWVKSHEKHEVTDDGVPLFDIAVIRVKQPFNFDETRQPIKLMDKDVMSGSMATVTGWGQTDENVPVLPHQLQVVTLPIVGKKVCGEIYAEYGGLPEAQICAGYLGEGGKGHCFGDSGGPLVVDGKLVGIASWVRLCGGPNDPGVYTEVAPFRDWIAKYAEL